LSAASLFEQVAKRLTSDRAVAVGLVASYAALNRPGDARRSAALQPENVDVRLALAWAELAALGGDPRRGSILVTEIANDPELARSAERIAMHRALEAIVGARAGDRDAVRAKLRVAEKDAPKLRSGDRAFLGYLGGIALREAGLIDDARATFALAMDASPESIGAALARRERANLSRYPAARDRRSNARKSATGPIGVPASVRRIATIGLRTGGAPPTRPEPRNRVRNSRR